MRCVFCGEEFTGRPVHQDGQIYCSLECADLASQGDEEYDAGDDLEDLDYDEDEFLETNQDYAGEEEDEF